MKLINAFKFSNEKKTSIPQVNNNSSEKQAFINSLLNTRNYDLAASQALSYYNQCAPLTTAIEWIATEGSTINPLLYDTKKNEFITDHPALDLLKNPNLYTPYKEFMLSLMVFYLLTGNAYIIAGGPIASAPVTLTVIPPQNVSPQIGSNGYVDSFIVTTAYETKTYDGKLNNGRYRYFSNGDYELYQIKNFNPNSNQFNIVGSSPLNPIYHEIEQYISSSIHNLSLLKRGATLSGIFKHSGTLSDDAYVRLKMQINQWLTGESNAGKPLLAEEGMDFESTTINNKDMDFLQLKENVTTTIYNRLKIPLPLVAKETMTLANFDAAKLELYDRAVLPLANRIFDELTYFFLSRYSNTKDLMFFYDEGKISALEPRRNENIQSLKDTGVVSTNELRSRLNLDNKDGGDPLYQSSTLVPFTE